ncbi:plantaricin C family lantibiotic [Paenibacillus polymyxa]|uniref:plantaricin C family lantibiotic n=1 Tax=Paenibacillus TaxID=44249 RepID=UPI002023DFC7|nr:plantaricin C family lantibiotic [Paenibacillus polymyxa]URJ40137.1 plantaricin C family lantibiotic [Paenibacillus polymyxa]
MKNELRNPISRGQFVHPAGNVMEEISEAELKNFAAGAGEHKNSSGVVCTVTAECNLGTLNPFCC